MGMGVMCTLQKGGALADMYFFTEFWAGDCPRITVDVLQCFRQAASIDAELDDKLSSSSR